MHKCKQSETNSFLHTYDKITKIYAEIYLLKKPYSLDCMAFYDYLVSPQMSFAYSSTDLSAEKIPAPAMFARLIFCHFILSA